jgi:hypothetical protein
MKDKTPRSIWFRLLGWFRYLAAVLAFVALGGGRFYV